MHTSIALMSTGSGWAIGPQVVRPLSSGWVRIAVMRTGLCRTDIQAMEGQRSVPVGRILGHESTGYLKEVPASLVDEAARRGLHEGDRVTLFPFLPCQRCPACQAGERLGRCWSPIALGLDEDGGFATTLDVPLSVVRPAPAGCDWSALAYVEPITASTAILDVAAVHSQALVAIVGEGRIALLTQVVLKAVGIEAPILAKDDVAENVYDTIIETRATEPVLSQAVRALRPGGVLVVKSRPAQPSPWPHQAMVFKRLTAVGAPYGDFDRTLDLLASRRLDIGPLLGPCFPLTEAGVMEALALERSSQESAGKIFLTAPESD